MSETAPSGGLSSLLAFITRDLLLLSRNAASMLSIFVIPALFLLCFVAVFGYAADRRGIDFVAFILAGCLFQTAMFTAAASAMAVALDRADGLLERLRIIPGAMRSFMWGRAVTDSLRMVASVVVLDVVAYLCGAKLSWVEWTRISVASLVLNVALSLLADGIVLMSRDGVSTAAHLQSWDMLLLMCSTAFVPGSAVTGWLHDVVVHMPFSPLIDAMRWCAGQSLNVSTAVEAAVWLVGAAVVGLVLTTVRLNEVKRA